MSAGAGVDGRQPGYFLRQQSRARGHLIDMYTERALKGAWLFKSKRGLCDKVKKQSTAVPFAIYQTAASCRPCRNSCGLQLPLQQ